MSLLSASFGFSLVNWIGVVLEALVAGVFAMF